MHRVIAASLLGFALAGCAGLTGPSAAPSCDGYSRRPLNRSMWDWDKPKPIASLTSPALPSEEPDATSPSPTLPLIRKGDAGPGPTLKAHAAEPSRQPRSIDMAASLQACTGERRHG